MPNDPTYNQFDCVSESRIHQTTNSLTKLSTQFLGCKAQQGSQWHDGDEVDDEDGGGVCAGRAQRDTSRHKGQEDVDIVAGEGQPGEVDEVHGPAHPGAVVLVERPAAILPAGERSALVGRAIEAAVLRAWHVVAVGVDVVAEGAAVFTESALDACNAGTS
jgi:hypothetical protein